jgi:hypothetical protein
MVLSNDSLLPPIPVSIRTDLPHIALQFGVSLDSPDVDTAASLTTGNLWFFTWLAKKFPSCVVAVYTSETHSPITLTGIVKSDTDGTKTSTELPVCFVFSLPYSMNNGTPTNLAVACGPSVLVNLT